MKNPDRRRFLGTGLLAGVFSTLGFNRNSNAGVMADSDSLGTASRAGNKPRIIAGASRPAIAERFEAIKKLGNREALYRFLYDFPKGGDIHHHLGGGVLPEIWFQAATDPEITRGQRFYTRVKISSSQQIPGFFLKDSRSILFWMTLTEQAYEKLPNGLKADFKALDELSATEKENWMQSLWLDKPEEGRAEFFEFIWSRLNHLPRSIHVMTHVCLENLKMFAAENVHYLELMTGPDGWRDENDRVLSREEASVFWKSRLSSPEALATGVQVRFQTLVLRFTDNAPQRVEDQIAFLDANRDLWVGINMAGREDNNRGYPERFTENYDKMLRKYPGIQISIHAGESEKADDNIFQTLRLGASRIGHGINLIKDPQTMQMMRNNRFLIEINLISNELLKYVSDLDDHPFPIYLRQGIPCCLNTDDRGMWHSNLTDEFFVAVQHFNLSWGELCGLAENSLKFAFAEPELKTNLVADWNKRLSSFSQKYEASNWQTELSQVPAITHQYGKMKLNLNLS